eukprot:UN01304
MMTHPQHCGHFGEIEGGDDGKEEKILWLELLDWLVSRIEIIKGGCCCWGSGRDTIR